MSSSKSIANLLAPIALLLAASLGFIVSNSPFSVEYNAALQQYFSINIGSFELINKSIIHLINDGLMAVFFLYVGLELKREIVVGELSSLKLAALPILAAIGGMVVPALIYFVLNPAGEASNGWGIPMATDIAFALGILAVLGSRVPTSLKVLLTAIAIVDDLGAILVIALFYTSSINFIALMAALGLLILCLIMNKRGVRAISMYVLVGIPMWYFMLKSGVHATIAGVALAMTIPLASKNANPKDAITDIYDERLSKLNNPALFLEKSLHNWISFFIIPIFAFANSGVTLDKITVGSVAGGILMGLVLGKPLGIVGASYLATKFVGVPLPRGVTWVQIIGLGFVAGIGFTMSLFIGSLAFESKELINEAKFGIILASVIAGSIGVGCFLWKPTKTLK